VSTVSDEIAWLGAHSALDKTSEKIPVFEHNLGEEDGWQRGSIRRGDEKPSSAPGAPTSIVRGPDGMSSVTTPSVVRQIGSLFDGGSVVGLTDRQLIERFNDRRDATGEAAFAALVTRHGPTIMHVCRQLLDDHHAEDAFQAVFLVLACKARSIRDPDKLGNWLYGVALRTAKKARGRLARRYKNEVGSAMRHHGSSSGVPVEPMVQPAEQRVMAREQAEILHREIDRLPGPFRLPIVLCYFEGLTLEEAAHRLRCPAGTVRSRLARACDKLRRGLTRRGVVLSAAGLVAALSSRSASASISSPLCDITTRAAINFAAGQSATGALSTSAMALAQEVLRAMFVHKLRLIATTLLLLAAVATGAGYLTRSLASQNEPKRQPDAPQPQVAARPDDTTQRPAPGRMFIVGRVLDPHGKPVPNATTMVYAAIKQPGSGSGGLVEKMQPSAIGQARSDGSGRFQVDAPRTSSARHRKMGAVAIAPGYGAGWVELEPDADRPNADISLWPEQVIQGRLFDLIGQPVQGVEVRVQSVGRVITGNRASHYPYGMEGPSFWWNAANGLPAWPKPAISDAKGRFTVRGVGRDLRVVFMIDDPRFARQRAPINTDSTSASKPVTLALVPAKIIRGRITEAETGKPIPHAQLSVLSYKSLTGGTLNEFEADADGRFRANPETVDRYEVSVTAPEGQPYLGVSKLFNWPKGAVEYPLDLALPRGVVIRGKVTEEGSGKPVAGARISFGTRRTAGGQSGALNARAASGSDGSFQIAVMPRPGYLVVLGPSEDYVLREIDEEMVYEGKPGGRRYSAHAFIACDVKPNSESLDVNVMLRSSKTVNGRVVGPDGQPIQDAWMISRVCLSPSTSAWLRWRGLHHGSVKSGQFEIHGLDPDTEVPVYFLDPHHKLGATADFSGKSAAGGSVTVRLQPCGTAKARLVDSSGKPISGYRGSHLISMVVSPSDSVFRYQEATLASIDTINYADSPVSDALGRIVFPALVPGAPYHLAIFGKAGTQSGKDFTVKPGETLDLGDFVIEKPNS
jgi:RNA polymerase sigma factor (sigma-70 family)